MIDLAGLTEYWKTSPPVHVSVAAYLGIKPAGPDRTSKSKGAPAAAGEALDLVELVSFAGPSRGRYVPPIPIKRQRA